MIARSRIKPPPYPSLSRRGLKGWNQKEELMKKYIERMSFTMILIIGALLFLGVSAAFAESPASALMLLPFVGMAAAVEGNYLSDLVLEEEDIDASRDAVTVLSGQNLAIGTVLGKILIGALSETHAGNTGNGAMTLDATTPALANCQVGVYKAACTAAAANGGTFEVFDPKGNSLGEVAVGATHANQIKFVIADGATDFIVGDTFLITVAAGSGKVKILTPAGLDGTQRAYGALIADVDASGADKVGAAIVREAVLKDTGLVWPGGITDGQKTTALDELYAQHITIRKGV